MNRNRYLIAIFVVLALILESGHGALAQRQPAPRTPATDNQEVSINFDNASIEDVIDIMSRITGKNFILDKGVTGTVTVIAPTRVPKSEAFGVFESILEMNDFSLVPMGNVIKVVPSRKATQKSIEVRTGREYLDDQMLDHMITQLIPIQYSDAQAVSGVLTPLISPNAKLTTYANTNTIILTETASNIDRMLRIIREIDIPGFEEKITIIRLTHARATILGPVIISALEPGPSAPGSPAARRTRRRTSPQEALIPTAGTQLKIIADERTNSLIVVANEVDTEQVEFLVRELDKATPVEAGNVHVFRPKNVLAKDIEDVLNKLGTASPAAAGQPGGSAQPGSTPIFQKDWSLVSDPTTNSLIVIASPQDFAVMKSVIEQLDIMRPQVLVETLIAEVSLDFSRDLGINWQVAIPGGTDEAGFAAYDPIISTIPDTGDIEGGVDLGSLTGDLAPSGLTVGYVNIHAGELLEALIQLNANETDTDFNILSAPHVLTLDNEKATINISDNVPFITSRLTDTGGSTDLAQSETFEYRDVGIILEITPHISPDRMVRLEIVQKVNEVSVVTSGISAGALSEKKREAQTTVMVKDRHTLVLGGLMKDTDNVTVSQVPFLGDLPILGWAFKSKSVTRGKINLLLFITPSIVTNVDEAAAVTRLKTEEAGAELRQRMDESPIMIDRFRSGMSGEEGDAESEEDVLYEAGPK
jgi:general secretion pathway protein D